jgi:hypothetical protein
MSRPRTFLLADDALHGLVVDQLIAERLRDVDGSKCSHWSGVYSDGERFGVLWAAPASSLFGVPITDDPENGDPSLVLAVETFDAEDVSEWQEVEETPAEPEP